MRLFIAVDINKNLRAVIAALQTDLRSRIDNIKGGQLKWVDPDLMHLTLKFIGEVEQEKVSLVSEIVASAVSGHKKFSFEMPRLGCFGRPIKVIWLGTETEDRQLSKLQQDIEDALDQAGWPKEKRLFDPHLTLARLKQTSGDRELKGIIKNYKQIY